MLTPVDNSNVSIPAAGATSAVQAQYNGAMWKSSQFTLVELFLGVSLIGLGCAGVRLSNMLVGIVGVPLAFGSIALIGVGIMTPFHKKLLGAIVIPIVFLLVGTIWYVYVANKSRQLGKPRQAAFQCSPSSRLTGRPLG